MVKRRSAFSPHPIVIYLPVRAEHSACVRMNTFLVLKNNLHLDKCFSSGTEIMAYCSNKSLPPVHIGGRSIVKTATSKDNKVTSVCNSLSMMHGPLVVKLDAVCFWFFCFVVFQKRVMRSGMYTS